MGNNTPKQKNLSPPNSSPPTRSMISSTTAAKMPPFTKAQKNIDVPLRNPSILSNKGVNDQRLKEFQSLEDPVDTFSLSEENIETESAHNNQEIENCLKFSLVSESGIIQSGVSRRIVCGVQIKVEPTKALKERVPMDLVCVIDDSGSMSGSKAQLVRKSLKYLLKIMNDKDRISFISFEGSALIQTPFLRNNAENKQKFKKAIKYIQGRGSTNIEAGIEAGLWMIKNRKEKNKVTCMFLLSDGQDDNPNVDLRVEKLIDIFQIKDTFVLNTYGYGSDHDAKSMRNIAEQHKGGYYYIEDIKKVSEWFVLSISGLMSAVGEDARITVKLRNGDKANIKMKVAYGGDQLWIKQDYAKGVIQAYIPHLIVGDNKFLVFECKFDSKTFKLEDSNRSMPILEADLEVKTVQSECVIRKNTLLQIEFKEEVNGDNSNQSQLYYEELMVTHARAVGGLRIKLATDLIKEKKDFEQAKKILETYKKDIGEGKMKKMANNTGLQHLDEDLDDAINKCAPKLFRQASFEKMQVVHCQRKNSICHQEDWNDQQQEVMHKFKNNEYNLSDDSCSDEDEGATKQQNNLNQNQGQIRVLRNLKKKSSALQFSDHSNNNSDRDNEEEAPIQLPVSKVVQKRSSLRKYSEDSS